ncbi:MAG: zinc-dependent peptidase [Candidatus Delongbacteria bacterium]|nr:zinc-dependent peptidase [Candidatus Delongbacteria bacterium]
MQNLPVIIFLIIFPFFLYLLFKYLGKRAKWKDPTEPFPVKWRNILSDKVDFYFDLNDEEKTLFEFKVQQFLLNTRITGIETDVDDTDRVLVAASAVIPIFQFRNWIYSNLYEVLLYSDSFNDDFKTEGKDRNILGMVGTGYMEGKMILSKSSLYHGFANENDKSNTAIHEFVHLIDKADGVIDGIPSLLLDRQYSIPWIELMRKSIDEIYEGMSDINPYGATNKAEFFSVISEYFFENPKLLEDKHPELYKYLEKIFHVDLAERAKDHKKKSISRNDPCPCGSGKKFKKCCGKEHF